MTAKSDRIILYDGPAADWWEGIPIGNGRLGAVVYEEDNTEILQINEDTLWCGAPEKEQRGVPFEIWQEAKLLTAERRYDEATELIEQWTGRAEEIQMYESFGEIRLEFLRGVSFAGCRRKLNLSCACAEASGSGWSITSFASAPDQCIIVSITTAEPMSLRISGKGYFLRSIRAEENRLVLNGQMPGRLPYTILGTPTSTLPEMDPDETKNGVLFEGQLIAVSENSPCGSIRAEDDSLIAEGMTALKLVIGVRTSFNGYDRHPVTEGREYHDAVSRDVLAAAAKPSGRLFADHTADYRQFFGRVSLRLGPDLAGLAFDYGRYLLISSSRPGTEPANLQGIWNRDLIPPWFCDHTLNINTQMNYWLAGPCSLPEMTEPLLRMNLELLDHGRITADQFFHCRGSAVFHNTDLWRKTSPAYGKAVWAFWPFGAAWMCRNLFDEYLFTGDRDYLLRLLPVLYENALFCRDLLEETPDGLAACPGTSPENPFVWNGKQCSVAHYTECNNAIIRNLFADYLEAVKAAGETLPDGRDYEGLASDIRELLPRIAPPKTGSLGQLLEWNEELEEPFVQQGHLSPFYGMYPGNQFSQGDPELLKAVHVLLDRRGPSRGGWPSAWRIALRARFGEGNEAWRILSEKVFHKAAGDHDDHRWDLYPGHPGFQLDVYYGITAAIAEMLIQSHTDEIVLLPALPDAWPEGSVTGLSARTGITADIRWENGQAEYILYSSAARTVHLRGGKGEVSEVSLVPGEAFRGSFLL